MNRLKILIVSILIAIILAATNPTKSEYAQWAGSRLMNGSNDIVKLVGTGIVEYYANTATTVSNFGIFSIFETDIVVGKATSLGILNNFMLLKIDNKYPLNENNNTQEEPTTPPDSDTAIEVLDEPEYTTSSNPYYIETEYKHYSNARFGFSVDYPAQFSCGAPSVNGDGLEFYSPDGLSKITVSGGNNFSSVEELYNEELERIGEVAYSKLGDNWYALSWAQDGRIYYIKSFVGEGSLNHLVLTYPEFQADDYMAIVTHVSTSFKPENINASN